MSHGDKQMVHIMFLWVFAQAISSTLVLPTSASSCDILMFSVISHLLGVCDDQLQPITRFLCVFSFSLSPS